MEYIQTTVRTSAWMQSVDAAFMLADAFKDAYYGVDAAHRLNAARRLWRGKIGDVSWANGNVLVKDANHVRLIDRAYAYLNGLVMSPSSGVYEIHMRLINEDNDGDNDNACTRALE